MPPKNKSSKSVVFNAITNMFNYLNNQIQAINQSKVFAGIIIITLNIASRFVNLKLSQTVESYLKHSFSRDILVFAIMWMGTRDIYVAFGMMMLFILCVDFIFNESSMFCCLPEHFTNYHVELMENKNAKITKDEISAVETILDKMKKINSEDANTNTNTNNNAPTTTP